MDYANARLFLRKKGFVRVVSNGKKLYYVASIVRVTKTELTLIDKFNLTKVFPLSEVIGIEEVRQ